MNLGCTDSLSFTIRQRHAFIVVAILTSLLSCNRQDRTTPEISIFPVPKQTSFRTGELCLSDTLAFSAADPRLTDLYAVLHNEMKTLTSLALAPGSTGRRTELILTIDSSLNTESYRLDVADEIRITGHDYRAVAMGTVTLLQLLATSENGHCIPKLAVHDAPDSRWRSLLIDLARRKHDLESVKNVVRLCRWYKVRYLQLHLTDDQLFTFPSRAFPELPTNKAHYTREELESLVEFAHAHGVELIPELEVPGHAYQLVSKLPHIFGFDDPRLNRNTINMARDEVYVALDTLVGEIARVFRHSRYIHMGGDEANFSGMDENPQVRAWMREHNLKNIDELFWHFINRMNGIIRKHGRSTVVWEGFSREGNAVIDKDITIMAWETIYQMPQHLLDGGFKIVNVSWVPNYVVNDKKWSPLQIYHWNIYRWENWVPHMPSYKPFQIDPHPNVIGGGMASWDQDAFEEISSLRRRVPAMVERLWNHDSNMSDSLFQAKLLEVDSAFSRYLSPVSVRELGRSYPHVQDGHYNEETWFQDTVTVRLSVRRDLDIRYTLDNSPVTAGANRYREPLVFDESTYLRYRAYDGEEPVGAEMLRFYELRPLKVDLAGGFTVPPDSVWATFRSHVIGYRDSVTVTLNALRPRAIRYVLGAEPLTARSPLYKEPIVIRRSTMAKAGLFVNRQQVGEAWQQEFERQ